MIDRPDRLDHADADRLDHADADRLDHADADRLDHADADRLDHADANRLDHADAPDHPAIARLRVELDAAWKGMRTLREVDDDLRDRIVAELRAAVPDVASRAAREAGEAAAVAEIRRFADADVVAADSEEATCTIWDEIVDTAAVAATAGRA